MNSANEICGATRYRSAIVAAVVLAAGCGDSRPPTYAASGAVRFDDGAPLKFGYIELIPDNGGPSARAAVAADGTFRLGTFDSDDGCLAGPYRVVITQHFPSETMVGALSGEHATHARIGVIDPSFSRLDTTPLQAEISAGAENEFSFTVSRIASSE